MAKVSSIEDELHSHTDCGLKKTLAQEVVKKVLYYNERAQLKTTIHCSSKRSLLLNCGPAEEVKNASAPFQPTEQLVEGFLQ